MADVTFPEGIRVVGNVHIGGLLTRLLTRAEHVQEQLARFPIELTSLRIWDAVQTNLGATAISDDDLAIVGGTFGTNPIRVTSGDVKTVSKTRYARGRVQLPPEYESGETVAIIVNAGMQTTIADGSATIDFEVHLVDKVVGSDLCATSATSINSTSFSEKTFLVTSTSLVPGDWLEFRVTIASVDTATGTAVDPSFVELQLACDIKG